MIDDLQSAMTSRYELHGPPVESQVVIAGRKVPFLEGTPCSGGHIDVTLDSRYGLMLTLEEADRFIPFLADAIAIGMGYTCHPHAEWDGPIARPPFPRVHSIVLTTPDADRG